jgi:hypothetical protein
MAITQCISRSSLDSERYAGATVIGDCTGANHSATSVHIQTHEGAVLGTWERNGYDDSDFYAAVWDGEKIIAVEYATTRGWTYHNGAAADATDEVKAAAAAWIAERDVEAWKQATAIDAVAVEKGKTVEVFKGRKVAKGTTGEVIWIGECRYKRGEYRVGIKDAAGEVHWTAESNCRVIGAEQYLTDTAEIERTTEARTAQLIETGGAHDWVSAYRSRGGAINLSTAAVNKWANYREAASALLAAA